MVEEEQFRGDLLARLGHVVHIPPHVPVPTLSPSLIESELFGHVRGAFTAAGKDKKGRLELADGGVLFLDEIGDIELSLQTKLLRFLDSGELYRVGDNQPRRVDALIVSATNRELRERPDDVPLLVGHFASLHGQRSGKKTFTPEAMELLKSYRWEFNVRQLQQVVEQMMYLVDHDVIQPGDLPDFIRGDRPPVSSKEASAPTAVAEPAGRFRSMREVVAEAEKAHIVRTLEHTKGNRREAIRHLEISSYTFYKRLEEFGLHKKNS